MMKSIAEKSWAAGLLSALLTHGVCDASEAGESAASSESIDWVQAKEFWAFQPPKKAGLPPVQNSEWPSTRLDYFILNQLETENLEPSPQADRRILLRRLSYVLTGLPPSPEDVEAFAADESPMAYQETVDRLLGGFEYGERLASLWLNIARYAEDQAHQVGSDTKHFYPNAHRYRAWVIDAFNQDLPYDEFIRLQLAADKFAPGDVSKMPAMGFLGLGPKYYNRGRLEVKADEWEDRVDTVSRSFLSLTVACARCHDHKYDPITVEDYHAMAGIFASTEMVNFVPGQTEEEKKEENKDDEDKKKNPHHPDEIHMVGDGEPQDLTIFIRGDVTRKGPKVQRRFLRILSEDDPEPFANGSGRQELAEAIAHESNPLTARVMVNRLWDMVFGQPLVSTPSNFGKTGSEPTHPELLDDLSVRFMENGWSVKSALREMVLSSTFQQTSMPEQTLAAEKDPSNQLYWRMNRRRMPVEMWRDSLLALSGSLAPVGGQSLELSNPDNHRRTVYGRVSRLDLNPFLALYDYPDPNVHSAKRSVTTTPLQKLFALNSGFMVEQAEALARRLKSNPELNASQRIRDAYELLYGRPPTAGEVELGVEFLGGETQVQWEQYAQALLAANELLYID